MFEDELGEFLEDELGEVLEDDEADTLARAHRPPSSDWRRVIALAKRAARYSHGKMVPAVDGKCPPGYSIRHVHYRTGKPMPPHLWHTREAKTVCVKVSKSKGIPRIISPPEHISEEKLAKTTALLKSMRKEYAKINNDLRDVRSRLTNLHTKRNELRARIKKLNATIRKRAPRKRIPRSPLHTR